MPRSWRGFYGRRWRCWSRIWTNRAVAAGFLPPPMSRECGIASRICCPASTRTHRPRLTLIQCCWPFRAWRRIEGVPLGQFHSDSNDLTEHFCFLRVPQDPNWNGRQGMRWQNDVLAAHAAPGAGMAVASFHKIEGTFVFRAPGSFPRLVLRLVDLYETAGRQNRIHGEIVGADIAVGEIAVGKLRQVGDGNQ